MLVDVAVAIECGIGGQGTRGPLPQFAFEFATYFKTRDVQCFVCEIPTKSVASPTTLVQATVRSWRILARFGIGITFAVKMKSNQKDNQQIFSVHIRNGVADLQVLVFFFVV